MGKKNKKLYGYGKERLFLLYFFSNTRNITKHPVNPTFYKLTNNLHTHLIQYTSSISAVSVLISKMVWNDRFCGGF